MFSCALRVSKFTSRQAAARPRLHLTRLPGHEAGRRGAQQGDDRRGREAVGPGHQLPGLGLYERRRQLQGHSGLLLQGTSKFLTTSRFLDAEMNLQAWIVLCFKRLSILSLNKKQLVKYLFSFSGQQVQSFQVGKLSLLDLSHFFISLISACGVFLKFGEQRSASRV